MRVPTTNAALNNRQVESACTLPREGQLLVEQAMEKLGLSVCAYHRILKVARTIADLAAAESIQVAHLFTKCDCSLPSHVADAVFRS